jgi:hypothetical protein
MVSHNDAPARRMTLQERHHHYHRHFSEGFRPTTPCSPHAPGQASSTLPVATTTPLPEEARRSSRRHHGITSVHLQPPVPPPRRRWTSNSVEAEKGSTNKPHLRAQRPHAEHLRPSQLQAILAKSGQIRWHPAAATNCTSHTG